MTFQHFPHGLGWNQMHWGHAVSTDMLHWVQKPIALEPGVNVPGDCFSGSVVVDVANTAGFKTGSEEVFVAIYTATKKGTCLAFSNDKGATWRAYSDNPVAIGAVNESTRDPHVFWHQPTRKWVAAEFETGKGMVFYNSALRHLDGFQQRPLCQQGSGWRRQDETAPDGAQRPLRGPCQRPLDFQCRVQGFGRGFSSTNRPAPEGRFCCASAQATERRLQSASQG